MSTLIALKKPVEMLELPPWRSQDETSWRAWVAKGRARDEQGSARRLNILKWLSIGVLVAAAGLWPLLATYAVAIRFLVAAGALFVTADLIQSRRYAFAAVFGVLAILLNPVTPMPDFASDGLRAIALAGAIPFVASLPWRGMDRKGRAPRS